MGAPTALAPSLVGYVRNTVPTPGRRLPVAGSEGVLRRLRRRPRHRRRRRVPGRWLALDAARSRARAPALVAADGPRRRGARVSRLIASVPGVDLRRRLGRRRRAVGVDRARAGGDGLRGHGAGHRRDRPVCRDLQPATPRVGRAGRVARAGRDGRRVRRPRGLGGDRAAAGPGGPAALWPRGPHAAVASAPGRRTAGRCSSSGPRFRGSARTWWPSEPDAVDPQWVSARGVRGAVRAAVLVAAGGGVPGRRRRSRATLTAAAARVSR